MMKNCKKFSIKIIILILIFFSTSSSTVEASTQREKLDGIVNETNYFEDNIGWISSSSTLTNGLKDFYKRTGIQPFVLLVKYDKNYWNSDNFNTEISTEFLQNYYEESFTDEGHFLFAYFESKNDSKQELNGEFLYLNGYSVDTVMDSEALSTFWGYFNEYYYDTTLSLEEIISFTFSSTSKNIMQRQTTAWDFLKILIVVILIVIIIIAIYKIIKNKNIREKEKEEYTKEILNTPLETFKYDTSELEQKYKN